MIQNQTLFPVIKEYIGDIHLRSFCSSFHIYPLRLLWVDDTLMFINEKDLDMDTVCDEFSDLLIKVIEPYTTNIGWKCILARTEESQYGYEDQEWLLFWFVMNSNHNGDESDAVVIKFSLSIREHERPDVLM